MVVEVCMNASCKNGSTREWKKGWPLRSGGFAILCDKCGSAYANSIFCNKFHRHQTGWTGCSCCKKVIHCGCIASRSLFEYLDFGGIACVTCVKASQLPLMRGTENPNRSVRSIKRNSSDHHTKRIDGRLLVDGAGKGKLMQLCRAAEASESSRWPQAEREGIDSCIGPTKQEDRRFSNVMTPSSHASIFTTLENNRPTWQTRSMHKSHSLNISMGSSSGKSVLPSASDIVVGRLERKALSSSFHQGQRSLSILPKPLTNGITMNLETNTGMTSQDRSARPPTDGRGKHQLLSRYWPKITDQELDQLSGLLKSTIVPLFEKVLSASDAGRIGRLVLPKSCAEAYFPPISQSEGLPLQILDVNGNEWTFQFRYWPNNNSRMYVLEGVTACMQAMQLNAGDTVTFSRIDPGGKIFMGFRRTSDSIDTQDGSTYAHFNDFSTRETNFSGAIANLYSESSYPNVPQTRKRNGEHYLNGCSAHLHLGTGTADCLQTENCETVNNDFLRQPISVSEKSTQNVGSKGKKLLIHNEDTMELKLTWEEAQDLLRPPPSVKPTIVTIEDQEFEEYEEPPVFAKGTTINARPYGSLSSVPEEMMSRKELKNIQATSQDIKKRRITEKRELVLGLRAAVSTVAVLGVDDLVDPSGPSAGPTTKHPRHRDGCTCIVCIQPPSGKGKHKIGCACLGCKTVKRRFNTIMRKKKHRKPKARKREEQVHDKDEGDTNGGASRDGTSLLEKEGSLKRGRLEVDGEVGLGQIDLNSHPNDEDI